MNLGEGRGGGTEPLCDGKNGKLKKGTESSVPHSRWFWIGIPPPNNESAMGPWRLDKQTDICYTVILYHISLVCLMFKTIFLW